jgi:hypothetical protein
MLAPLDIEEQSELVWHCTQTLLFSLHTFLLATELQSELIAHIIVHLSEKHIGASGFRQFEFSIHWTQVPLLHIFLPPGIEEQSLLLEHDVHTPAEHFEAEGDGQSEFPRHAPQAPVEVLHKFLVSPNVRAQ